MLGLYIHIPFCVQKCKYCDFNSYKMIVNEKDRFLSDLKKEMALYKNKDRKINSIFFGGGTPSILNNNDMQFIMDEIKENFSIDEDAEISMECNPGTLTEDKLKFMRSIGVNRLSIGLQAVQENLLRYIGRIHNYEQFEKNYLEARKVGFKNINIDLMIGLPVQTLEDVQTDLKRIIELNPEHISVYSLIVEEGTRIEEKIKNKELYLPPEELERKMYWEVKKQLKKAGYVHYEISNFAKPGYESKHNLSCWNQEEYLGFGIAAHSYFNGERYSNTEDFDKYFEHQEDSKIIHEKQTQEDKQREFMLLGLRKIDGVKISDFKNKFIENPIYLYRESLNKLVTQGLIEIDIDSIKLTNRGIDLANLVWEEFV